MIQFCEIINTGTNIRIVTRQTDNESFNDPIEFEIDFEINNFDELVLAITNYLENAK